MTLNEYQDKASETAVYPGRDSVNGLVYAALGLGEAGEVQNKVKKILRDDNGVITPERILPIVKELGGNLWYISQCAHELGYTLEEVAQVNVGELADRKERGVLSGSGDDR